MAMTPEEVRKFKKAAMPLIKWMQKNSNPHAKVIVEQDGAELLHADVAVKVEVPD